MNDDTRLERLFGDALQDIAPTHAPDRLRTRIKAETDDARPRARWLALIKEPPMRTNSRLAVGSPTWRVTAILVATLLLATMVAGASFAGAQILAQGGPIVVDPSGAGDYTTIAEAVAAADDGDEVLIRPGIYIEAVTIDKDITVSGDGEREEIILEAPEDGPTLEDLDGGAGGYVLLLDGSDATVSGVTFRGPHSEVVVRGASPVLTDLLFDSTGFPYDGPGGSDGIGGTSLVIAGGSTASVSDSVFRDGGEIGVFEDSAPRIEGNELSGGPHIYLASPGAGTVVDGNEIDGANWPAINIFGDQALTISNNRITNAATIGINGNAGPTANASYADIIDNVVIGSAIAGIAGPGIRQAIGNTLINNRTGIVSEGNLELVESNVISDGGAGVAITAGKPSVQGNLISGMTGVGVFVASGASPTLSGNDLCGNAQNVRIMDGATPVDDGTNEICEDGLAE